MATDTTEENSFVGLARPRIGLLGNPSDGYGGRVVACSFDDFLARVSLTEANQEIVNGEAAPLVRAALRRFERTTGADPGPCAVTVHCDIPRQAGLSGSSAIIIATLRAQMERAGRQLSPLQLARMALAVEVDDLGITAGPQDRIVQAYEGLLDMDFSRDPFATPRRLDVATLPPLYLAWSNEPGDDSGAIHRPVRERFDEGEPLEVDTMTELARLAAEGVRRLESGESIAELVNRNFELRAKIFAIDDRDRRLVHLGRQVGAAVKFCGSGGAVVGVFQSEDDWPRIRSAHEDSGYLILRPRVTETGVQ